MRLWGWNPIHIIPMKEYWEGNKLAESSMGLQNDTSNEYHQGVTQGEPL